MIALTPPVASQKMLIVSNLSGAARTGMAAAIWPPKSGDATGVRRELSRW
jgi:hypothetical protein